MSYQTPQHVIELINKAYQEKATFLDLGNCGLENIPAELALLAPQLEGLNLGVEYQKGDESIPSANKYKQNTFLKAVSPFASIECFPNLRFLGLKLCAVKITETFTSPRFPLLISLDVSSNQIGEGAAQHLAKLTGLTSLSISYNQIGDGGARHLAKLTGLTSLYISYNRLNQSRIFKLNGSLTSLHIHYNPIKDAPLSIIVEGLNALRLWWQETEIPEQTEPNRWVKMQVTGNGNVGKSSVIYALNQAVCPQKTESTHGILLETLNDNAIREIADIQVWDFGGQEIYHGTHRMFLGSDSIQLLVYDAFTEMKATKGLAEEDRITNKEQVYNQPLSYWRENVLRNTNGNELIIAENKIDEYANQGEDFRASAKKTGQFVSISATTGEGIPELRQLICTSAKNLRDYGMPIPKTWLAVRQWFIDNLKNPAAETQKLITIQEFKKLCTAKGVSDYAHQILLDFLHYNGLVYANKDLLGSTIITDLRWALDAIYKPLERSGPFYEQLVDQRGKVRAADIFKSFGPTFTNNEYWLFLSFMQACGICFPHKDNNYSARNENTIYIFPRFLPVEPSEAINAAWQQETEKEVTASYQLPHYSYSQAQELLVNLGPKTETRYLWRSGLIFKESTGALWLEFKQPETLIVKLKGSLNQDGLLSALYKEFSDTIFGKEISFQQFSERLKSGDLWKTGRSHSKEEIKKPEATLQQIPDKIQAKIPVIVASFAKENEWAVKQLDKQMDPLKDSVIFTWDRNLQGEDVVPNELLDMFKGADGYIVFACPDYVNSKVKKFIHEQELPLMIKNKEAGAKCYGIMVIKTKLQKAIEDNFLFFEKGKPVPTSKAAQGSYFHKFITEFIEDKFLKQ